MTDLATPDERDATAGEYVLGTLDEADRAAFEAALAQDADLRARVYAWQDRLLGLTGRTVAVHPEPGTWARLARSVDAATSHDAATTPSESSAAAPLPGRADSPPSPVPRPAPPRSPGSTPRPRWWDRLAVWQGLGGAALAASAVLAVLLVQRGEPAPHPRFLAVLQSPQDRSTGWVVEVEADRTLRLVPLAGAVAPGPGQSLQFWTKPEGAAGPTSLGLVRAGTPLELPVARLPAVAAQTLFEITLEPAQGSPVGRPTGPILYVGRTVRL